ncbi:O-antigen ligase family protein [Nubsella zeaxanthinifaciens]|uniref:O-antigen ligase family protein n=1 Tax=Nubsella zeaxanthinifaciens TaxID=392412 RepID=UPI003D062FB9
MTKNAPVKQRFLFLILFCIACIVTVFYQQPITNCIYRFNLNILVISYLWVALGLCGIYVRVICLNKFDLLFIGFVGACIIVAIINYSHKSDLNLIENVTYGFFIYLPIRAIMNSSNYDIKTQNLVSIITITTIALIIIKALVMAPSLQNINGGTFNSTYFSNYITLFVPILWYIKTLQTSSERLKKIISTQIILIIVICLLNQARGSIIGLAAFLILQLDIKYIYKKNKGLLVTIISGCLLVFYFLAKTKIDSANGRIFIWQNALILFKEQPFGIGLGNFKQAYAVVQSKILTQHNFKPEFLLADVTDYAFNDLLQYVIEGGALILLFIISFIYLILKSKNRFLISFSLLVFIISSTGYILHSFLTLSIVLISFCLFTKTDTAVSKVGKIVLLPTYVGLFWSIISLVSYLGSSKSGVTKLVNETYTPLDNKHLYDLAVKAFDQGKFKQAITLLLKSGMTDYDIDADILLAKSYENLKDTKSAEIYYLKANSILPRMFKPKHYLLKFYSAHKNEAAMRSISKEIIETPIKVHSNEISNLRKQAEEILRQPLNLNREN